MASTKGVSEELKAEIVAEVKKKLTPPQPEPPKRPKRYRLEIIEKCTECGLCRKTENERYHSSLSHYSSPGWYETIRACFHPSFEKDGYPHRVIPDHHDRPPDWCPLPTLD